MYRADRRVAEWKRSPVPTLAARSVGGAKLPQVTCGIADEADRRLATLLALWRKTCRDQSLVDLVERITDVERDVPRARADRVGGPAQVHLRAIRELVPTGALGELGAGIEPRQSETAGEEAHLGLEEIRVDRDVHMMKTHEQTLSTTGEPRRFSC